MDKSHDHYNDGTISCKTVKYSPRRRACGGRQRAVTGFNQIFETPPVLNRAGFYFDPNPRSRCTGLT